MYNNLLWPPIFQQEFQNNQLLNSWKDIFKSWYSVLNTWYSDHWLWVGRWFDWLDDQNLNQELVWQVQVSRAKTQKQAAKEKCAWPVMSNWPFLYLFVNYLDLYVILDSFGCTSRVGFQFEQGFVAFFTMWPFQWFMYKHVNCVHVHELWMNEELKWCCRNIWKLFQELRLATRFWLWRLGGLLNWNTFWAPGIMSVPSDQGREVDHPEARNTGSEGGPGLYWAHNHNGRQQSYDGRPMKQWLCLRACLNIVRTGTFVPTVLI